MPKEIIIEYVKQHIDEDDIYTEDTLPDDPQPLIPRPLGMEDALFYSGFYPQDDFGLLELSAALDQALENNNPKNRREIYGCLDNLHIATIYDKFTAQYTDKALGEEAYQLGKSIFYEATSREYLKLSLLLLGFYGMEKIAKQDSDFWQDIITLARCEEFTVYFVNACTLTAFCPNRDYWRLVNSVKNWGKVSILQEIEPRSEAERLWLIINGYNITISFPALAPRLAEQSQLQSYLEWADITEPGLKGALAIISNMLQLIDSSSPQELQKDYNIEKLNLPSLIFNVLYHAAHHELEPLLALQLLQLNNYLRSLAEEQEWTYLKANDCHRLIASCDNILFSKDWNEEIPRKLIQEDKINYLMADLAYELDQDIWEQLYEYFLAHPLEISLFPYLLSFEGDHRSERVITQIDKNYNLYADSQEALAVPLRYLKDHPGQGAGIIIHALTGMFDFPRGYACAVLNYWGPEYMTTDFQEALKTALLLNHHEIVTSHIQDLIAGIYQPLEPEFTDSEID